MRSTNNLQRDYINTLFKLDMVEKVPFPEIF